MQVCAMQSCKDACQPAGVRLHARGMCYTHKSNSDNAFFKNPTLPLRKIHHLLRLIGEEERWACWRPPLGRRRHGCRFRLSLGATRPDPVVAAPWRSAAGFAFGYVPRAVVSGTDSENRTMSSRWPSLGQRQLLDALAETPLHHRQLLGAVAATPSRSGKRCAAAVRARCVKAEAVGREAEGTGTP
jgi:hypothetical protein